ncbi:MAG: hypothetical protein ACRCRV_04775 [Cetobacterium sp.]
MSKLDFDTIARNMFGANADRYKEMAQGLNQNQMQELMLKFQNLPNDKKQQFMKDINSEVEKIKNSNGSSVPTGIKPNFRY